MRTTIAGALAAGAAACVTVMLVGQYLGLRTNTRFLLMAASTGFVLIPIVSGGHGFAYGRLLILGLALCWLGDLLGPTWFIASLVAFLLAHIAFIVAFATRGVRPGRLALGLGACAVAGSIIGARLWPHVPGEMRLPILAYIAVISLMVTFAGAMRQGTGRLLVLVGAIAFYISDIFVARWKFVDTSSVNAYFCYPLYYAACLMLALSVLACRPTGGPQAPSGPE